MKSPVSLIILAVLLLLALFFLVLPYRRDIQAANRKLKNMERQTIQTACGPIEAAMRGEGEPVLVSHGISGGFDQGLGLADAYLKPKKHS